MVQINNGIMEVSMLTFANQLTRATASLFKFVLGPNLRNHPVWGQLLPYDVSSYGCGPSFGHVVRPDIIMLEDGTFQVCELDTVPSGRGFLLNLLTENTSAREEYLDSFASWYESIYPNGEVLYATGTQTICFQETTDFSTLLNERGVNIRAVNIDATTPNGSLIDRLFYKSELHAAEKLFPKNNVITAEPVLDSKLLAAVIHAPDLKEELINVLGVEDYQFLLKAFPKTYSLNLLVVKNLITNELLEYGFNRDVLASAETLPNIIGEIISGEQKKDNWLIKSGEVEDDFTWGSRSVVLGSRSGQQHFHDLLSGKTTIIGNGKSQKNIGKKPILQEFFESYDFQSAWEAGIRKNAICTQPIFGEGKDPLTIPGKVYARLTFYMLLDNVSNNHTVVPFALNTLRKQPLAHGANDSMFMLSKLV